jgi:hypothetical protein
VLDQSIVVETPDIDRTHSDVGARSRDTHEGSSLGIVEEGDSEAFAQQIAAAVAYALSWRA